MFFCKERKRTQRSSAKNGKERENVSFFCKRTRERSVLFSIYIYRYIYRHIYINIFQKKNGTFFKKNGTFFYIFFFCRAGHSVIFRSVCYILFCSKKERSVLFRSFLQFLATYETQKNVPFFSKERKRTQRMFRSF